MNTITGMVDLSEHNRRDPNFLQEETMSIDNSIGKRGRLIQQGQADSVIERNGTRILLDHAQRVVAKMLQDICIEAKCELFTLVRLVNDARPQEKQMNVNELVDDRAVVVARSSLVKLSESGDQTLSKTEQVVSDVAATVLGPIRSLVKEDRSKSDRNRSA